MDRNFNANIVVIDDEIDLCELLEYHLSKAGFNVTTFLDTRRVKQFLDEENSDLLIIDRNLNGIEGARFLAELRQQGYNEPAIFLSAKNSNDDKLKGFESGADDYITKPFEIQELIARIKAVLKRSHKINSIFKFKGITINLDSNEVFINAEKVELTKLEFSLLLEFVKNENIVLTREYLLDEIWQESSRDRSLGNKSINIAIKRLRAKLGNMSKHIKSIRSQGYKLC